jgi:hypothetical protein
MPVDEIDHYYLEIAQEGFGSYDDYFNVRILNDSFNATDIRIKDGLYLTTDFFKNPDTTTILDNKNLDILLIVTDHTINNWDDDGKAIWGQADTKTSKALMTTYYFDSNTPEDDMMLRGIAIHEVFHIFGYHHTPFDNVMQYAARYKTLELSNYYKLQLPLRTIVFKFLPKMPSFWAVFLSTAIFSLVLLPLYIVLELIVYDYFNNKNKIPKRDGTIMFVTNIILSLLLLTVLNLSIVFMLVPGILIFKSHYIYNKRFERKKV